MPSGSTARATLAAAALAALTAATLAAPITGAIPLAGKTAAPAFSVGQQWRDYRAARGATGIDRLQAELLYAGGRLDVSASDGTLLYDARLRYDAARMVPRRLWRDADGVGRLRLAAAPRHGEDGEEEAESALDSWDMELDLEELARDARGGGRFEFALHPSVPTELRLGIGAGRVRLDLGGLSLESLELATGAGDIELDFAEPNRVPMELLAVKAGAGGFAAEGLGNARFERLEFLGVVGDVMLDFFGAWSSDAEVEVRMGLGELVLRVPAELGVRLQRSGLGRLSAPGLAEEDGAWLTPNWDDADRRLRIRVVAGVGAVTIERG